jgi:hypothetical protein
MKKLLISHLKENQNRRIKNQKKSQVEKEKKRKEKKKALLTLEFTT